MSECEEEGATAAANLAAEVAWCLESLARQLEGGKLGDRKAKEVRKVVRLIKDEGTKLPQRRQLMRTHCGDYRAKMKGEEEALKIEASKAKFIQSNPKTSNSNFIKKKAFESNCDKEKTEFKFNFTLAESSS